MDGARLTVVGLYLELENVLNTVKLLLITTQDLIISNWSTEKAMVGCVKSGWVDQNGSRHGFERALRSLGKLCFCSTNPRYYRLTGQKTPQKSPPGARSADGRMC